jgi:hypothetical protein
MEPAVLEQLQQLPESVQQQASQYLKTLIAQHTKSQPDPIGINRQYAFGIWEGKVSMSADFDAPLEDMHEYM